MKAKLIIINWLCSWVSLCIPGNIYIAVIVVAYFGFSSWLLIRNKKIVNKALDKVEDRVDKSLTSKK
jgi:hypothetical protein